MQSISINNVINVALLEGGRLAARDNVNVVGVLTSSQDVLNSNERYRVYKDVASVLADFGTSSKVGKAAQTFFATSPNAVNFGGLFVVGYWRGAQEITSDTSATLKSAELSEVTVVKEMQQIANGSFTITVDGGVEIEATGLNFQSVDSLDDIASIIDNAIVGATATVDNLGIVITSDTDSSTSTLTYLGEATSGTFIGNILNLAEGTGAELTQGVDSETLVVETKVEAITQLKALTNLYGAVFLDKPTSSEAKDLATWSKANSVLMYDVFSSPTNLQRDTSNVVYDIALSGLDTYRMLYSKVANRQFAVAYMARTHTVNFNAENSANTMNLKELPITPEEFSQTEVSACKSVGLDIYTTIKQTPIVLTSDKNDFVDYRYNLIAFKDAVETDLFNLLKSTSTKIPQTTKGVNQLVSQCEKTTRGFARAGVFAPGTWSSPDSFGDLETFKRNISEFGFYFLAGSLAEQPQSDREARKSPVIQGAVKMAGAIHQADIIININK